MTMEAGPGRQGFLHPPLILTPWAPAEALCYKPPHNCGISAASPPWRLAILHASKVGWRETTMHRFLATVAFGTALLAGGGLVGSASARPAGDHGTPPASGRPAMVTPVHDEYYRP